MSLSGEALLVELKIPRAMRSRAAEIVAITDEPCGARLGREYTELARVLAPRGKATARATSYFFLTMPMDWTGALSAMQFVRLL